MGNGILSKIFKKKDKKSVGSKSAHTQKKVAPAQASAPSGSAPPTGAAAISAPVIRAPSTSADSQLASAGTHETANESGNGSAALKAVTMSGNASTFSTVSTADSNSSGSGSTHNLRRFLGGRARRRRMAVKEKLEQMGEKAEKHHAEMKQRRSRFLSALRRSNKKPSAPEKTAGKSSGEKNEAAAAEDAAEEARIEQQETEKLVLKYGEVCHENGKKDKEFVLGEGAGGAVLLVKQPDTGKMYAVKKFRKQNFRESVYEYKHRLEDEYNIASALFHPNVVRTYELMHTSDEKLFVIVMDYCPYDFFALVMAGIVERKEAYCYFRQMVRGVRYMHRNGFAHRDLKLDNCVVTKDGILKLVDYGSVAIFDTEAVRRMQDRAEKFRAAKTHLELRELVKKLIAEKRAEDAKDSSSSEPAKAPIDDEPFSYVSPPSYTIIKARGVAGSDPYLAPECLSMAAYDPRAADVWSLAIIYCCVILHRFPWKLPRKTDPAFKAFTAEPGEKVDSHGKKHVYGPQRLLKALPSKSRDLIGHMLEIDPEKRYTIEQVADDPFLQSIDVCHVGWNEDDERYVAISGKDHEHHLLSRHDLAKKEEEERERRRQKKEQREQKKAEKASAEKAEKKESATAKAATTKPAAPSVPSVPVSVPSGAPEHSKEEVAAN